ncbi:Na+/H+ antiporter subunit G [Reinekea thalattae]|uniref:Na+/H+ antiporter subunit G n=1 Tax=Reinekea thalattae TaxID=2593301 RepID=A0A5C8Z9D2_9GAMM|nr:Na+/H+ antiporter subunit G [Reinekea thalattae]TXR54552.1 Na+/H+ antiporter subunit G [Reinekea thalattae]
MTINEIITAVLLLIGGLFLFIGSIGLVRLPDFFTRLHAPTKASTLGIGAVLIASLVYFSSQESGINIKELLITLFIVLSAPITAHMLSKAALHVRLPMQDNTLNKDMVEKIRNRESS